MVSIAGATPGLWAVDGGNKQVPEKLLQKSKAHLIRKQVTSIEAVPDGTYKVSSSSCRDFSIQHEGSGNAKYKQCDMNATDIIYDSVIIATPLTKDKANITFKGMDIPAFPGHFERLVTTMLQGKLNHSAIGNDGDPIGEVLTTLHGNKIFQCIGQNFPVESKSQPSERQVWKVFSGKPFEQVNHYFTDISELQTYEWLAYPHYNVQQHLGEFELRPGLYHVNAIESLASAMEMSLIGAKNVALLIQDQLAKPISISRKTEL